MLDEKQIIEFKSPSFQDVVYEGTKIKVKPYMSLTDMGVVAGLYIENYFSESPSRVIQAEYALVTAVLEQCTNLEISEGSFEAFLGNVKLWDEIVSKIKNYGTFRALLKQTVEEKKEEIRIENTTGKVISVLSGKILGVIEQITSAEITPESIDKLKELLKDLESSSVFKNLSTKLK